MKKIIYSIFVLCSICMLSSCEIDDDCLDDDIRRAFEQERRGSIDRPSEGDADIERPEKYDADCMLSLGESAFLEREGAVRVNLSGKSTGYKYYFSGLPYTDEQIRMALESQKLIKGEEFNFAVKSYSISYGGKAELYLYAAGYDDKNNYGPIVEAHYTVNSEWFYRDPYVSITGIEKNGKNLTCYFLPTYFSYNETRNIDFYVMVDEEAEYASDLSDPELAVYIKSFRKYSTTVKSGESNFYTFNSGVNPKSVMIVTEMTSPLIIKKFYKRF